MEDKQQKKVYIQPTLTVHGDMATITLGQGLGLRDFVYFGLSDVIGTCRNDSCGSREPWGWIP